MKDGKGFFKWLKRPHGVMLVLLYIATVAAIAGSIVMILLGETGSVLNAVSYGLFGLSAVLLGYSVYTVVIYAPGLKTKITESLKKRKFTTNLLEHYGFKTLFFAFISLGFTVAFAVMNGVSAIMYRSIWYGAIAGYYVVLILFRGGVILADRKCRAKFADCEEDYERSKWLIYRGSGIFLVVLEIAMCVAVTQMMLSERPAQSGQIMAITNATYTFWKISFAVYNLVKARKFDDPVTQSLRNLNFADACMSVVSLTTLMLSTFGESPDGSMKYLKAAVGFAACAVILALATVMIIRSDRRIKKPKGAYENGRQ